MSAPASRGRKAPVRENAQAALPVQTITGFLGAGKTTLIQRLLASRPPNLRVAVIVNEFGLLPFDGVLLRDTAGDPDGLAIYDLPGGCLCCTQAGELHRTLAELATRAAIGGDRPLDRILIEASGAATASLLTQFFDAPSSDTARPLELAPTVAIVDAPTLLDRLTWDIYVLQQQLRMADLIVLNRVSTVTPEVRTRILEALCPLNPAAPVLDEPPPAQTWAQLCQPRFPRLQPVLAVPSSDAPPDHASLHAALSALEIAVPPHFTAPQLADRLEGWAREPSIGRLLRAKAFLATAEGYHAVELAGGRAFIQVIRRVPPALIHRLVLIGRDLQSAALNLPAN